MRRLDSPLVPLGIAAAAYFLLIVAVLGRHGYDPSYLVQAGDQFANRDLVPRNLIVLNHSAGYDGQFYYRLALDPFTTERTEFGITLDTPPYRQQRIVYPLLVWALSLGRAELVPTVMILVNYAAVCLTAWLGGLHARSMKQHALWGLVFSFYAGFALTLSKDLTEVMALSFVLASLWLIRQQRSAQATILLALAVLTKETTVLVALAAFCVWAVKDRAGTGAPQITWHYFIVPGVLLAVWQLILLGRWGQIGLLGGSGALGWPFVGLIAFFRYTAALQTTLQRRWFTELVFLVVFAVSILFSLRSSTASRHVKLAWLLYAGLASVLTGLIWVEDWAFLRALSEFYILGAVILLGTNSRIKVPVFAFGLLVWLLVFAEIARSY